MNENPIISEEPCYRPADACYKGWGYHGGNLDYKENKEQNDIDVYMNPNWFADMKNTAVWNMELHGTRKKMHGILIYMNKSRTTLSSHSGVSQQKSGMLS